LEKFIKLEVENKDEAEEKLKELLEIK